MAAITTQQPPPSAAEGNIAPTSFTVMNHAFPFLSSKKNNELLSKWYGVFVGLMGLFYVLMGNLLPDLKVARFRSSTHVKKNDPSSLVSLVRTFVNDPAVCSTLGTSSVEDISSVTVTPLSCTILNMNFFDAVTTDNEVVTSTDLVRACMDETFNGITIQDKLREMLVNPDSENCHLFTESEKKEWIYHLLKLVCVGGSMCQAEDKFTEWKDMTKAMYKDTVNVQKSAKTGKVEITSQVFQVDEWGGNDELWKKNSVHNKYYMVIDPGTGIVNVIYKPFIPFW